MMHHKNEFNKNRTNGVKNVESEIILSQTEK